MPPLHRKPQDIPVNPPDAHVSHGGSATASRLRRSACVPGQCLFVIHFRTIEQRVTRVILKTVGVLKLSVCANLLRKDIWEGFVPAVLNYSSEN